MIFLLRNMDLRNIKDKHLAKAKNGFEFILPPAEAGGYTMKMHEHSKAGGYTMNMIYLI